MLDAEKTPESKSESKPQNLLERLRTVARLTFFNDPAAPPVDSRFTAFIQSLKSAGAQPQELQGLWQAYGQVRAAGVTGRFALLATAVAGVGLWGYQQALNRKQQAINRQKEELEAKRGALEDEKAVVDQQRRLMEEQQEECRRAVKAAAVRERQFAAANEKVLAACKGDPACLDGYHAILAAAEKEAQAVAEKLPRPTGH